MGVASSVTANDLSCANKSIANYAVRTMHYVKLCVMMSKLVYDAMGKCIPTRFRQIIETESDRSLAPHEREMVSED